MSMKDYVPNPNPVPPVIVPTKTVTLSSELKRNDFILPRSVGSDADMDSVEDEYAVGASEKEHGDTNMMSSALRRVQ